ncbi:MAG: iron-containing alcohol dehydrogenase [Bacteroidales bacterium]|nr:MAG: iron-containing alcohol dehydrogenase [Bacteroidales bacterium]
MVESFKSGKVPQIIFGKGTIAELPSIIKKAGRSVLVITGAKSFEDSSKGKSLLAELESENLAVYRARVLKEPSPADVDKITDKYFNKNISIVVAIGGGSVLDTGKAVSAMILSGEKVKDYLEGVGNKIHSGIKLPFVAIPTTSGTGSETTNNAVISEVGQKGFKKSLRHANFVPDYAIVDPELTLKCNAAITAASGMDAFSQLLESYLSDKASIFTDSLAIEGLRCISMYLLRAYEDGNDIEARTGMAYAAMVSGITLSNAGLGVIHGFASSLGGYTQIPHGIACGTLMGIANRKNVEILCKKDNRNNALKKYATVGKLFINDTGKSDEYYARAFIYHIEKLVKILKIPGLGNFGVRADQVDKIVDKTGLKNNPVLLSREDLSDILLSRI